MSTSTELRTGRRSLDDAVVAGSPRRARRPPDGAGPRLPARVATVSARMVTVPILSPTSTGRRSRPRSSAPGRRRSGPIAGDAKVPRDGDARLQRTAAANRRSRRARSRSGAPAVVIEKNSRPTGCYKDAHRRRLDRRLRLAHVDDEVLVFDPTVPGRCSVSSSGGPSGLQRRGLRRRYTGPASMDGRTRIDTAPAAGGLISGIRGPD